MTITAASLISTLVSQASNSTNRQTVAAPAAARPSLADTATISQAALAAATGGASATQPASTTYDFTHMTNSQAIAAEQTLSSEGKISPDAQMRLMITASGWDTICINPTTHAYDPAAQASMIAGHLSSTTPLNFVDTFKNYVAYDNSYHNTKEAALDTEVLQDMEKYSSNAGSSSVTPGAAGAIISTPA
jgi:hypothetical protein